MILGLWQRMFVCELNLKIFSHEEGMSSKNSCWSQAVADEAVWVGERRNFGKNIEN